MNKLCLLLLQIVNSILEVVEVANSALIIVRVTEFTIKNQNLEVHHYILFRANIIIILEECNTLWGRAFTRDLHWFLLTIMKGYIIIIN